MDKHMFYVRQRPGNAFYTFSLYFPAFLLAAGVFGLLYAAAEDADMVSIANENVYTAMFLGITMIPLNIIFIVFAKIKVGLRRKKLYKKFEGLPDADKAEINAELAVKFRRISIGANRFYYKLFDFIHFIDYQDIAWVYGYNIAMPIIAEAGGVIEAFSANISGLAVWTRDGKRHKVPLGPEGWHGSDIIEAVKAHAPDVIVGFNKKRLKLAKRDFERFMLEGRGIV